LRTPEQAEQTANYAADDKERHVVSEKPVVVLTRRWPEAVEAQMAAIFDLRINPSDQPMSRDQLAQALLDADVICPTVTDKVDAQLLSAANVRTRLLANFGVGFNHIDIAAAKAQGISVTNTPGVLTDATAEIAMTLLLTSARRTGEGERLVRSGGWDGWRPTHMLSTQVTGKTLGIIGMGRIGTALARQAHHGFAMSILYSARNARPQSEEIELNAVRCEIDELLQRSDFVSINCPATLQTQNLINLEKLTLMQPHAHLVNTARGDIVNEADLVTALRTGVIAGAGLDVFVDEPNVSQALIDLPQVVLLPHMGSGTRETREAMGRCALANIQAYLSQQPLPNRV
jgi:glyoxylate reductase